MYTQMSDQDIDLSNNTSLSNPSPKKLSDKSARPQYANDFQYLMSALGYTVGYGSLWRFPYIMYKNGGGVFLIPYTFFVLVLTIPLYLLETGLGQIYQKTLPIIFEKQVHRCFKGIGLWTVIICIHQMGYYNLILTYSYAYFFQSFKSPLPWSISTDTIQHNKQQQMQQLLTNSQDFFFNQLGKISIDINHIGEFNLEIFMVYVLACSIVFISIYRGPQQSGQVAIFTATIPYVFLLILFSYGLTLEGNLQGIAKFFEADISRLYSSQIWIDALVQVLVFSIQKVLFQFSTGTGVYIMFSSYRFKGNPLLKTGITIMIGVYICGLLGGITIFQYLGHIQYIMEVDISSFKLDGPQLIFIVYPCALSLLPMSTFFSLLFFAMFIFLGIDTMMGIYEAICGYVSDQYHSTRLLPLPYFSIQLSNKISILLLNIVFGLIYSLGWGFHLLFYVDEFNSTFGAISVCISEIYFFVINTTRLQQLNLKILQKTGEEIPQFAIWSMKLVILPIMIVLLIIGTINFIKTTIQLNLLQSLILWLIPLYPLFQIVYIYIHNYKHIQSVQFSDKFISSDSNISETELPKVKYLKLQPVNHHNLVSQQVSDNKSIKPTTNSTQQLPQKRT